MVMDWQIFSPLYVSCGIWPHGMVGFSAVQGAGSVQGATTRSSTYLGDMDSVCTSLLCRLDCNTHGRPPYARRILAASPLTLRSKYVNLMSAMARLVTVTMF